MKQDHSNKKSLLALKLAGKFQHAISLLVIHGIISDGERDKARARLEKWAVENGLKPTVTVRP